MTGIPDQARHGGFADRLPGRPPQALECGVGDRADLRNVWSRSVWLVTRPHEGGRMLALLLIVGRRRRRSFRRPDRGCAAAAELAAADLPVAADAWLAHHQDASLKTAEDWRIYDADMEQHRRDTADRRRPRLRRHWAGMRFDPGREVIMLLLIMAAVSSLQPVPAPASAQEPQRLDPHELQRDGQFRHQRAAALRRFHVPLFGPDHGRAAPRRRFRTARDDLAAAGERPEEELSAVLSVQPATPRRVRRDLRRLINDELRERSVVGRVPTRRGAFPSKSR